MRLTAALALTALLGLLGLLWITGTFAQIEFWAAGQQRALQSSLATGIQDLRSGGTAALWSLLLLCGGYGFVHAVGPGHGKVLITGATLGSRGTAARMVTIALLGSLAQALVAILLVYGAFALFQATARGTLAASDAWVQPAGNLFVAAIGAWLLLRGLRALTTARPDAPHTHCGHDHGPTPAQAARATSLGATLALIGGMAARPCAGAIVVLVIAWRMGFALAGALGVLAMGLGTAAFTVLIALTAVLGRDAAVLSLGTSRAARPLLPILQILAGGLICAISLALFRAGLPG